MKSSNAMIFTLANHKYLYDDIRSNNANNLLADYDDF